MSAGLIKNMNKSSRVTKTLFLAILVTTFFLVTVAGMVWGAVSIGWRSVFAIIFDQLPFYQSPAAAEIGPVYRDILLQIRIPRVLLAAAVGSSLAVSGAVFQGLFRNPMADPYVIGISSGAALGAVFAMLGGFSLSPWVGLVLYRSLHLSVG
jgi:iron complex transport system permease protein